MRCYIVRWDTFCGWNDIWFTGTSTANEATSWYCAWWLWSQFLLEFRWSQTDSGEVVWYYKLVFGEGPNTATYLTGKHRVVHSPTGRTLTVETDQPGMQFYTGNFVNGIPSKNGSTYEKQTCFCLETQNWPDAINHVREYKVFRRKILAITINVFRAHFPTPFFVPVKSTTVKHGSRFL